ncbi:MAG: TonB-dependent receptor, partial [Bacteroidetes bacterium]|nr:TonB-dependent receptor [Bacteroidota bacterium]
TAFTRRNSHNYYVEDGSYLRLRTMQLGYNLPASVTSKLSLQKLRVYLQGQNLLTLTKYSGPDPDINFLGVNPSDDLKMGVDEGGFPTARQILFGVNISL